MSVVVLRQTQWANRRLLMDADRDLLISILLCCLIGEIFDDIIVIHLLVLIVVVLVKKPKEVQNLAGGNRGERFI